MYKTRFLAKASVITEPKTLDDSIYVEEQPDLLVIDSVLVSVGINANDDVFLRDELLAAYKTARHKPLNIEHQEEKIVGHMIDAYLATKSGERIDDNIVLQNPGQVPAEFDVINRAVMYAYIFPGKAREIRQKAATGELFVSVEAYFTDYDYLVGDKIVRRNEVTARVLDPVLKVNGGSGELDGQRVGRVLRNIIIGGIGLVRHPANKDSVIKSVSEEVAALEQEVVNLDDYVIDTVKFGNEEVIMEDKKLENIAQTVASEDKKEPEVEEKLEEKVEEKLEEKPEEKLEKEEEQPEEQLEQPEEPAEEPAEEEQLEEEPKEEEQPEEQSEEPEKAEESELEFLRQEVAEKEALIKEYEKALAAISERLDNINKELDQIKLEKLREERARILATEFALSGDALDKLVERCINMSDEEFVAYVEDLAKVKESVSQTVNASEEDVAEEDTSEETEDVEEEVADEIDETIDDVLDSAAKEEDPIDFTTDEDESLVDKYGKILKDIGLINEGGE